jgi:hypothetical protein
MEDKVLDDILTSGEINSMPLFSKMVITDCTCVSSKQTDNTQRTTTKNSDFKEESVNCTYFKKGMWLIVATLSTLFCVLDYSNNGIASLSPDMGTG